MRYVLVLACVLFVLTIPLERRHLFITADSFVTGVYTEATTPALYVSDLAFGLLVLAWLVWRLRGPSLRLFPSRGSSLAAAGLVAWTLLRAFPGGGAPPTLLGLYGALRVAQGVLLSVLVADLWRNRLFRTVALVSLLGAGLFEASLGIAQTFRGESVGAAFLGEPPISLKTSGVAKVDLEAGLEGNVPSGTIRKILRAYGTLPHPNVLGGFLVVSLVAGTSFLAGGSPRGGMFRSEHFYVFAALTLLSSGLLLTYSRSALLALVLLLAFVFLRLPRNLDKVSRVIVLSSLASGFLIPMFRAEHSEALYRRIVPLGTDAFLQERKELTQRSLIAISRSPLEGVGVGRALFALFRTDLANLSMPNTFKPTEPWKFQLPHSVPLLVVVETGVIGLVLLVIYILTFLQIVVGTGGTLKAEPAEHSLDLLKTPETDKHPTFGPENKLRFASLPYLLSNIALLAGFSALLIFDHYGMSLQPGRALFFGALGVLAARRRET